MHFSQSFSKQEPPHSFRIFLSWSVRTSFGFGLLSRNVDPFSFWRCSVRIGNLEVVRFINDGTKVVVVVEDDEFSVGFTVEVVEKYAAVVFISAGEVRF